MQEPQEGATRRSRRTGEVQTYQGGQWVTTTPPQRQDGPVLMPMQTPADRRAEDAADRAERAEERQLRAAERTEERQGVQSESALRQEFMRHPDVRSFPEVRGAYQRIGSTGTSGTAAGDLSLIFAYMKMLDPGSTVREGEFANAQNATGVPGQIVNLYNQVRSGQRLNDAQRADFLNQAGAIYQGALESYNRQVEYYQGLATQYGYSPDNVARPEDAMSFAVQPTAPQMEGAAADVDWGSPNTRETAVNIDNLPNDEIANLPPGTWIEWTENGRRYVGPLRDAYADQRGLRPGERADERGRVFRETSPMDRLGAFSQGFAEQIPFGDEAVQGAVGALTGEGFSAVRDRAQELSGRDRASLPGARRAGGIAGAAAGLALPAGAANRAAQVGMGYGALYGAGAADGGLQERGTGAAVGAAAGYGVGRAVQAGAPWVGEQAGRIGNALADAGRPIAAGFRNAFGQANPPQVDAINALAARALPVEQMQQNVGRFREFGADPVLADVIGDAGQGQVRVAATRSTQGRQAAADFATGRRSEIQDFAARQGDMISPINQSQDEINEALRRYQSQASRPAFDAVRGDPIALDHNSVVALRGDQGRAAIRQAANLLASSADDAERAAAAELRRLGDDLLDRPGEVRITVGAADLLARYLNRAGGTDANAGRVFGSLGSAIRDNARRQSTGYDEALRGYAERAQLGDAAAIGERFVGNRGDTRDFVRGVSTLNDDARSVARAAARAGHERQTGTARNALAVLDAMATSRHYGERANALLGPETANRLREAGQAGRHLAATAYNVNPRGGSNTFLNLADNDGLEDVMNAGRAVVGGATGNFGMAMRGAVDWLSSRGFTPEAADELVSLALDPNRTDEAIQLLAERMSVQEARSVVSVLRERAGQIGQRLQPVLAGQAAQGSVGLLPQPAQ